MKNNKDAIQLFLKQEGKELRGKKNTNIVILFSIFLAAILSVGFGGASLSYLEYKMDDPFIDWVEIYANQNVADQSDVIPLNDFIKSPTFQSKYHFQDPEDQYELYLDFCHKTTKKPIQLGGRNIKSNSEIIDKVFNEENVISKNEFLPFSDDNLAIIVTQDALKRLGYSLKDKPDFIFMSLKYDVPTCNAIGLKCGKRGECQVAFPIYAIVKQLPGMYSYMFSDQFLYDIYVSNATAWDITDDEVNGTLNYVGNQDRIGSLKSVLNNMGVSYSEPTPYCQSISSLLMLSIPIDDECNSAKANSIDNVVASKCNGIIRIYDFPHITKTECDTAIPEKVSVHIDDLKYIRDFQNALYDKCGYKIDMTNVDAKENFNFVQRMGNVLSICIIIIASLLICFFIYFMLSSHFHRIQKNLGTFKAFGISNKVLTSIYMRLMIRMTVISFASAFVVSFGLSKLFDLIYPPLEEGYPWIDVLVIPNLILFVLVIVATFVSTKIVNRKLNNTPGDLIYNRVN